MRWLKRDGWKVGIALAGLLLLLLLTVLIPLAASAYEGTSGAPIAGTVRTAPMVDVTATMTALNEEKLKHEDDWWWSYGATILSGVLSALLLVGGGLFGFWQWRTNRNDTLTRESNDRKEAQDKELRAQAEERFKTAIAALGDENEATQVGGAILLRSFLNPKDKAIYGRYYAQIFDLAAAYLRFPNTLRLSEDPDGLPLQPTGPDAALSLTPLRQALINVFKEAYPLVRDLPEQGSQSLDALFIHLDRAYLARCDLKYAYMRKASFRSASLHYAKLNEANLYEADFSSLPESVEADLRIRLTYLGWADLSKADLRHAKFIEAKLIRTNFTEADLRWADLRRADCIGTYLCRANLSEAKLNGAVFTPYRIPKDKTKDKIRDKISRVDLSGANLAGADLTETMLTGANLSNANIEEASSLKGTDLRGVKGLTREQLIACKARGGYHR